jgi:hypothetical protein
MSPEASKAGALTLEALEEFIRAPLPGEEISSSSTDSSDADSWRNALVDAAAVLADFDPFALRPRIDVTASDRPAALDRLIEASEPVSTVTDSARGAAEPEPEPDRRLRWTLKTQDRRQALRRLGSRETMRAALGANPDASATMLQLMFEMLIRGDPIEPSRLDRDEIAALVTAAEWLDGILDELPSPQKLRRELARADLLAPLRRLVQDGVFGRTVERGRIKQHFELALDFCPPLFVHGPGGSGKSTLVARSILDQEGVHFAYVDIDNPKIRPERPVTFLLEIVRQLKTEIDHAPLERLEASLVESLGRVEAGRQIESAASAPDLHEYLANLKGMLGAQPERVIISIDTFEEVQFLGDDVVEPTIDFFFDMSQALGSLRLVISGRALPRYYLQKLCESEGLPFSRDMSDEAIIASLPIDKRPLDLADLEVDDARELLTRAVRVANISPLTPEETDDIIGIVGRNPMSLRLAARVLRDGGLERLRQDASRLLLELKAEKVQAMLYGRILHHIHLDDIAKIAYPGLVVRRITPEIIRKVLARPCKLELTTKRDEFAIWRDLAREVALVQPDDGVNSLRHRLDVRRVMLQDLLDHVEPEIVAEIDRRAVSYYRARSGGPSRAEEIYHRLRREEPFGVIERRWSKRAIPYLRDALEDFSTARVRFWLANKLSVTLGGNLRQQAELEDWEAQAARAVDRYLSSNSPQSAFKVLRERPERSTRSPLYALEAETLRFLGKPDEALSVARAGVDALSRAGALDAAVDLLLKMVVIEESRLRLDAASVLLREVQPIAAGSSDPLLRLRAIVNRLRVDRQLAPANNDERNRLRKEAALLLTEEVLYKLRARPVLMREVAAELSSIDARLAGRAIQTLGLEVETDEQLKAFADAISQLGTEGNVKLSPSLAAVADAWQQRSLSTEELRNHIEKSASPTALQHVASSLFNSNASTLKGFREYFRSGVDSILKSV